MGNSLGNCNSISYFIRDLKRHECEHCVYVDETCYKCALLEDSVFIRDINEIKDDHQKNYIKINYKLQQCERFTEDHPGATAVITFNPWRLCNFPEDWLGKMYYSELCVTSVKTNIFIMRNFLTVLGLAVTAENSFTRLYVQLYHAPFFKNLFKGLDFDAEKSIIYIDNDGIMSWDVGEIDQPHDVSGDDNEYPKITAYRIRVMPPTTSKA